MNNNQTIRTINIPKKQEGMVLIVALIMLLLISVLGISAVNRSNIGTQVAGNSMSSMLVYQGVETGIARTWTGGKEINIKNSAEKHPLLHKVPVGHLPADVVAGGVTMKSKGTVESIGVYGCKIISGIASSTSIGCDTFEADVKTNLAATSAVDRHIEGRALFVPLP